MPERATRDPFANTRSIKGNRPAIERELIVEAAKNYIVRGFSGVRLNTALDDFIVSQGWRRVRKRQIKHYEAKARIELSKEHKKTRELFLGRYCARNDELFRVATSTLDEVDADKRAALISAANQISNAELEALQKLGVLPAQTEVVEGEDLNFEAALKLARSREVARLENKRVSGSPT